MQGVSLGFSTLTIETCFNLTLKGNFQNKTEDGGGGTHPLGESKMLGICRSLGSESLEGEGNNRSKPSQPCAQLLLPSSPEAKPSSPNKLGQPSIPNRSIKEISNSVKLRKEMYSMWILERGTKRAS